MCEINKSGELFFAKTLIHKTNHGGLYRAEQEGFSLVHYPVLSITNSVILIKLLELVQHIDELLMQNPLIF